ncbi:MAG TPA: GH116 family glycosyl-hydrolase, partial [Gallionella sp.]|nr:GH116 family glycosyl-hydrolase [Gallionella sp.]
RVSLEAFAPFIPHEPDESGLPVAVLRYRVTNPGRNAAQVSIAWSIDNPCGGKGRENEHRKDDGLEGLFMTNPSLAEGDALKGSFALCLLDGGSDRVTFLRGWEAGRWTEPQNCDTKSRDQIH